jgi:hypothetical protein
MRKIIIPILIVVALFLSGCAGESAEVTENAETEAVTDEATVAVADVDSSTLVDVDSEDTTEESDETEDSEMFEVAGITFLIPSNWQVYHASEKNYIGYNLYPPEVTEKPVKYYFQVSLVSMNDTADISDPNEAVINVARGTRNIKGCEDYTSSLITVSDATSIRYKCHLSESGYTEQGCLVPIYDSGMISVFYGYYDGNEDIYGEAYKTLIDSLALPEEETFNEKFQELKEQYSSEKEKAESAEESSGEKQSKTSASNTKADAEQESKYTVNSVHNYYTGVSSEGAQLSDQIASDIAASIMGNTAYTTDLQRVTAATEIVKQYCDADTYGMDTTKYYRSPYGVFIAGVYTCAGSTRALGRILDYMGFEWQHTHENQNRHQWCVLTMDGQTGYADGMAGIAGYGTMTNGMTLPDGSTLHFAE